MPSTITRRDQIAAFIEHYASLHGGNAPSLQEIATATHMSKTTVDAQVKKLRTRKVKIAKGKYETKVLPGPKPHQKSQLSRQQRLAARNGRRTAPLSLASTF